MTLVAGDILASARGEDEGEGGVEEGKGEGEGGGDGGDGADGGGGGDGAPIWAVEGDIIFANSTCFTADLMQKIAKKCEHMNRGAQIITLTRSVASSGWWRAVGGGWWVGGEQQLIILTIFLTILSRDQAAE